MKKMNFILYVTHHFLSLMRKANQDDLKGRVKGALTMMLFLTSLQIFATFYALGINFKLYPYNKSTIFIIAFILFLVIRYFVVNYYSTRYDEVLIGLNQKLVYSKSKIIFYFLFFWFTPIFFVGFGMILIRKLLFHL